VPPIAALLPRGVIREHVSEVIDHSGQQVRRHGRRDGLDSGLGGDAGQ